MTKITRISCFLGITSTIFISSVNALDTNFVREKNNVQQTKETLILQQQKKQEIRTTEEQKPFLLSSFTEPNQCDNSEAIENNKYPEEEGNWSIGNIDFKTASNNNQTLKVRSSGESSLDSYNFVGKVGGVNFEEIAVPDRTIKNQPIELSYDATASDGQRLVIKVGNQTIRPQICDWMLIPIANFANSEYTAIVSLFGEGVDRENFYYITFHPAFKNTLIGLRLLQADILLMNPQENSSLPEKNGQTVLGHGEAVPKKISLINELVKINQIFRKYKYTAWVLTDTEKPAFFSVSNGNLDLDSSPYYYFWRRNELSIKNHQSKVNIYNNKVKEYNELITNLKSQISSHNAQVARYNADNSSISVFVLNQSELEINNQKMRAEILQEELTRLKLDLEEGVSVDPVPELTNEIIEQFALLKKINPLVFEAVELTAGYASLFRYIKLNHNNIWNNFMQSISNVKITPAIKTPTEMTKKI